MNSNIEKNTCGDRKFNCNFLDFQENNILKMNNEVKLAKDSTETIG